MTGMTTDITLAEEEDCRGRQQMYLSEVQTETSTVILTEEEDCRGSATATSQTTALTRWPSWTSWAGAGGCQRHARTVRQRARWHSAAPTAPRPGARMRGQVNGEPGGRQCSCADGSTASPANGSAQAGMRRARTRWSSWTVVGRRRRAPAMCADGAAISAVAQCSAGGALPWSPRAAQVEGTALGGGTAQVALAGLARRALMSASWPWLAGKESSAAGLDLGQRGTLLGYGIDQLRAAQVQRGGIII